MMPEPIDRRGAETYAQWFRALADPTRIQIVNLLARCGGPMTVGEIVAAAGVGQSTVSHHLKVLRSVGFVKVQRIATSSLYEINERCVSRFPSASDLVMGRLPRRVAGEPEPVLALVSGVPDAD